jgi:hydroxymethylpyrimidine pyrophosphatase-like HAD family hydrolase
MRRNIILTDLDDTLFSSAQKGGGVGPQVTVAKNGHHGHMSPVQEGLFRMLFAAGEVIPVTARSSDAFARVQIDFGTRRAILANGAVILDASGEPDQEWNARTAEIGLRCEGAMEGMVAAVTEEFGDGARSWIVREYGAPVYFCVKMNRQEPEAVEAGLLHAGLMLEERFDLSGFQHHVNGNNLSFTPLGISKLDACARLIEQVEDRAEVTLFGVGDSLTDLPFMRLCDVMITPSGSQIANQAMRRTVGEGVLGEGL